MSEQNNQKIKQVKDEYEARLTYIRYKKSGIYLIPVIYVLIYLSFILSLLDSGSKIISLQFITLFIISVFSMFNIVYVGLKQCRNEEEDAKFVLQKKLDYHSGNTNESNGGE